MQTKLTLRLESELIQLAKDHAKQQGKSLSQVVADYFKVLTQKTTQEATQETIKQTISPITNSLIGVLESGNLDKDDYKNHLEEKYL
jgi:hypothetical protein